VKSGRSGSPSSIPLADEPPERLSGGVVEWKCGERPPYVFPTVTVKKRTLYAKIVENF
jgi:hypothetical protein